MRAVLGLLLLAGCGFSGGEGASSTPDGSGGNGNGSGSGKLDAGTDGQLPAKTRRIELVIAAGAVQETLTDFPVYVDLSNNDLKTRLDAASLPLSFRQRTGATVANLDYEIQSFDQVAGRLRAWVRLPSIAAASATTFELQYGDPSVKVTPNAAGVWRNGYKAVFHLEQAPVGAMSIVNSLGVNPGTPTGLIDSDLEAAQLGNGINFKDAGQIAFTNPITGSGPSTISAWLSQRASTNDDALVVLGNGAPRDARWLHSQYKKDTVAVGLYSDDWADPGLPIVGASWHLVHWTYMNQQSRLYHNGALVNGSPFTHNNTADTKGSSALIGNAPAAFGTNMGIHAIVDEVRVANVVRSLGWIAAEYQNQLAPTTFLVASGPLMLP